MPEPLPVIPLEYAKPADSGSPTWPRIVRVAHRVALSFCLAGTIVIGCITTRYGVLAGLVIAPAGVLLVIGGGINRDGRAIVLGVCHVGVCVLFTLLVNLLDWDPDDAHVPMTIMGTLYTLVVGVLAGMLRISRPSAPPS